MLSFISCENNQKSQPIEKDTIEGTYYYSNTGEGLECEISIYGDSWSGTTSMWGNVDYQNGIVKGNTLYDESGYARIGSANGKSLNTTIGNGSSITLRKR